MKEVASTIHSQPSPTVGFPSSQRSLWHRLASWLRSRFEIPYGYEDESGFHYGVEPVPGARGRTVTASKLFTDRASDVIPTPCPVPLTDTDVVHEEHRHPSKG